MIQRLSSFLYARRRNDERGLALPEALVSAVIILIVLVASGLALIAAFSESGSVENFNKAYQIVNQQFSTFKQATWYPTNATPSYIGTVVPTATITGCDTYANPYNGENVATVANASQQWGYTTSSNPSPFQYCQGYKYTGDGSQTVPLYDTTGTPLPAAQTAKGIGITFYVTTVISNVTNTTFDGATATATNTSTYYNPKRITVTVRWTEADATNGTSRPQVVRMSEVRTPTIGECVPTGITDTSGNAVTAGGC